MNLNNLNVRLLFFVGVSCVLISSNLLLEASVNKALLKAEGHRQGGTHDQQPSCNPSGLGFPPLFFHCLSKKWQSVNEDWLLEGSMKKAWQDFYILYTSFYLRIVCGQRIKPVPRASSENWASQSASLVQPQWINSTHCAFTPVGWSSNMGQLCTC